MPLMTTELDNTLDDPRRRATLVTGETGQSLHAVTEAVAGVAEAAHPPQAWYVAMAISLLACWACWG